MSFFLLKILIALAQRAFYLYMQIIIFYVHHTYSTCNIIGSLMRSKVDLLLTIRQDYDELAYFVIEVNFITPGS